MAIEDKYVDDRERREDRGRESVMSSIARLQADNEWIKSNVRETNQGVKDLQSVMVSHMSEMRDHYATSDRVTSLEAVMQQKADKMDVDRVDAKMSKLVALALTATLTFSVSILIEIVRIITSGHA